MQQRWTSLKKHDELASKADAGMMETQKEIAEARTSDERAMVKPSTAEIKARDDALREKKDKFRKERRTHWHAQLDTFDQLRPMVRAGLGPLQFYHSDHALRYQGGLGIFDTRYNTLG